MLMVGHFFLFRERDAPWINSGIIWAENNKYPSRLTVELHLIFPLKHIPLNRAILH
jgi:hypothetical protein